MRTSTLAVSLLLALSSCSASAPQKSATNVQSEDHDKRRALEGAALVLDVRTKEEYEAGHLANARLTPVDELEAHEADIHAALGGDKSKKVVTYCKSGRRSEKARQWLLERGYQNVVNAGGYEDLKEEKPL